MFPWSPEFVWDAGHVIFFGAFYSVLAAIAGGLGLAAWRAFRDARDGRLAAVAWHAEFEELPRAARACRHQLTGEAPDRVCEKGFDCRGCGEHAALEKLRPRPAAVAGRFGFDLSLDRFYHRGHTWARPEVDGTVSVGLDDVARRLVGTPDAVVLPPPGTRLGPGDLDGYAIPETALDNLARACAALGAMGDLWGPVDRCPEGG